MMGRPLARRFYDRHGDLHTRDALLNEYAITRASRLPYRIDKPLLTDATDAKARPIACGLTKGASPSHPQWHPDRHL